MKKLLPLALAALLCHAAFAQIRVTGTVTSSDDGTPAPFVTVVVKGNNSLITSTDIDGKYVLHNVPANAVLTISAIGYITQEVAVNNRTIVDIIVLPDVLAIEGVMVVAYGTAQKGTYTGAASVVRAESIKDVPNVSFQNALNGKVAGLQVSTPSGQAGAIPSIRIRGTGSMHASNEPLYVVDGVPVISGSLGQGGTSNLVISGMNAMSALDPSDIESMTILKDAAASALYGSRAANGVIMVQTKRGKSGKPRVDFKTSYGFSPSFATDNYEKGTVMQTLEKEWEIFENEMKYRLQYGLSDPSVNWLAAWYPGKGRIYYHDPTEYALAQLNHRFNRHGYYFTNSGDSFKTIKITDVVEDPYFVWGNQSSGRAGKYFDWDDVLFRTATWQSYSLSVSGATETTSYYTSISYTADEGRYVLNDYNRISGRLNVTQKVGKFFEISSNVSVSKNRQRGFEDTNDVRRNVFFQSRNLMWGLYYPTIYFDGEPWTESYGSLAWNDVYYRDTWNSYANTLRVSAIETLTAHILPELTFKTTLSYDNSHTLDHFYRDFNNYYSGTDKGMAEDLSRNISKLISSSILDFNITFGEKHTVSALAGFEGEQNRTDYQRSTGTGFSTPLLETVVVAGETSATAYWWGNNMMSVLSKAEYNYDSKYYFSASYRRDGSSKLGSNTRWGDFWSVAGAWKVNNEAFMQGIDWLSNLRLRASYGVNGTLPPNDYGHMSLTSYRSRYMGNPGGSLTSAPNPNLKWETSYTYNLALEFGLFANRLSGTIEYFNRDSKNLLQDVPISLVTGMSSTLSNIGEINNRGWEIELNGDVIRNGNFTWNLGITASAISSKVTKMYDSQELIYGSRFIYKEGFSPLSLYGREYAGVQEVDGFGVSAWYLNNDRTPDLTINGRPATLDYTKADEKIIGKIDPDLFGGIFSNFRWKGILLDLNFIYKIGGKTYDWGTGREAADDGYYWERTVTKDQYENRWTPENKNTKYPQIIGMDFEDVRQHSTRHMHDATFLRLKNITLSYSLPKQIVEKAKMSNARIYFNGANLWTLAAYKVYDPEVNASGVRGWEMPIGKTFTFGLEIGF